MPSVLVIEDDQRIRQAVANRLSEAGHAVATAPTAFAGLEALMADGADVVILDLGLPDLDGAELMRMIRATSKVPIIIATARDDDAEIVRLLDAGADDYVVKPYTAAQLEARIRAVLRRTGSDGAPEILTVADLRVDADSREVRLGGEVLDLTRKEFDLLLHLARNAGAVVERRELFAEVWRQPYGGSDKTLDVHLSWLRKKLGETATSPRYLHTVRGVGVKLVDPTA
jgi:DNA-binding response OmpR family regulator